MKVGDLVGCNHPHRVGEQNRRFGIIVKVVPHNNGLGCRNKMFKVVWGSKKADNRVWDYDLKLICDV